MEETTERGTLYTPLILLGKFRLVETGEKTRIVLLLGVCETTSWKKWRWILRKQVSQCAFHLSGSESNRIESNRIERLPLVIFILNFGNVVHWLYLLGYLLSYFVA
jgi:hypothetical protein